MKELLWRFVCEAHVDRKTNHVARFVAVRAKRPEQREVFFTVRYLNVEEALHRRGYDAAEIPQCPHAIGAAVTPCSRG